MVKQQINVEVGKDLYLKFKSNCVLLNINVGTQIERLLMDFNREFEGKERWTENEPKKLQSNC